MDLSLKVEDSFEEKDEKFLLTEALGISETRDQELQTEINQLMVKHSDPVSMKRDLLGILVDLAKSTTRPEEMAYYFFHLGVEIGTEQAYITLFQRPPEGPVDPFDLSDLSM